MPRPLFLCFGEVLWDLFPDGPRLGGSSANVAVNVHRLGANAKLISRVGRDDLGDAAIRNLSGLGLDTSLVQRDDTAPTGSVSVSLDDGEPSFRIASESAWDQIEVLPRHFELTRQASGLIYGTLAQRSVLVKGALLALLQSRPESCTAICDLNLRAPYYDRATVEDALRLADVVKLNEAELAHVARIFDTEEPTRHILETYAVRLLAITRGSRGCMLCTRSDSLVHTGYPLLRADGDSVGAGDAFTAALAVEFVSRASLSAIAEKANDHARRVASARGGFGFVP